MPPFLDDFGYVIEGTYVPPAGKDPYIVELLSRLEMSPFIQASPPFPFVVNEKDDPLAWMKNTNELQESLLVWASLITK